MKQVFEQITIDDFEAGNLITVDDDNAQPLTPSTDTRDFEPVQMRLSDPLPTSSTDQAQPPAESTPVEDTLKQDKPTTSSEPTTRELELFKKLHGSSFDPNSSMDKRKLEQLRQAAQQTGEEDVSKLASAAYTLQAKDKSTAYTPQRSSQKQSTANKATAPASPSGGPTYYVRTGFNQYRPAVNADITSNQQLFMKNPNPVGRAVYPYVKVDSRSVRRASPAR